MSRQFRVYLLPDDIEWLISRLRDNFEIRLLQENSKSAVPVELASPLRNWPAKPGKEPHSDVFCYLTAPEQADIRLWYAAKRAEWLLHEQSEMIEFSGCNFDGIGLADGRFYFHTDKLVGETIVAMRPEFLALGDRVFRSIKTLLRRSKALDAWVGPETVVWWRNGGTLVADINGRVHPGSQTRDL